MKLSVSSKMFQLNSHIKFDIVLPWKNMETQFGPDYTENWGHSGSFTYVLLKAKRNR